MDHGGFDGDEPFRRARWQVSRRTAVAVAVVTAVVVGSLGVAVLRRSEAPARATADEVVVAEDGDPPVETEPPGDAADSASPLPDPTEAPAPSAAPDASASSSPSAAPYVLGPPRPGARVTVLSRPAHPVAGQPVDFDITFFSPNGYTVWSTTTMFGDGMGGGMIADFDCAPEYVATEPEPSTQALPTRHVYEQPGRYDFVITVRAAPVCSGADYSEEPVGRVTVTVGGTAPASPSASPSAAVTPSASPPPSPTPGPDPAPSPTGAPPSSPASPTAAPPTQAPSPSNASSEPIPTASWTPQPSPTGAGP